MGNQASHHHQHHPQPIDDDTLSTMIRPRPPPKNAAKEPQQPYTPKINNHSLIKQHQQLFLTRSSPPPPSLTETSRSIGSPGSATTGCTCRDSGGGSLSGSPSSPGSPRSYTTAFENHDDPNKDSLRRSVRFSSVRSDATVDQTSADSLRTVGSFGSASTTTTPPVKASCLHENLMRCQHRDPLIIYDLVSVLGEGSMVRTTIPFVGFCSLASES